MHKEEKTIERQTSRKKCHVLVETTMSPQSHRYLGPQELEEVRRHQLLRILKGNGHVCNLDGRLSATELE